MAGCAERPVAVAVDLAPIRCPDLAVADKTPFAERAIPAPAGDMTTPKLKTWIDARKLQFLRAQHAGTRVVNQYEACRAPSHAQAGS